MQDDRQAVRQEVLFEGDLDHVYLWDQPFGRHYIVADEDAGGGSDTEVRMLMAADDVDDDVDDDIMAPAARPPRRGRAPLMVVLLLGAVNVGVTAGVTAFPRHARANGAFPDSLQILLPADRPHQ